MKMTLDLPDSLLREVKVMATKSDQSLNDFVTEAITLLILSKSSAPQQPAVPEWRKHYGGLAHIANEVRRMQREIDDTFGVVNPIHHK